MNSIRIIAIMSLVSVAMGCRCFQNNPERDVGKVQQNVGSGYTEIYPRTNVQPYSGAVINGPLTSPANNSQGTTLAVAGPPPGSQVPVAATPASIPMATGVPSGVPVSNPVPVYAARRSPTHPPWFNQSRSRLPRRLRVHHSSRPLLSS